MYEAFFECARRPFSATPDADCWFTAGPFQPALDELLVCAEQGQGIGILVGPAGSGKSTLCERLVRELQDRFEVIVLHHATFANRRALLQTILSALKLPIQRATDQELRLELGPALRQVRAAGRAVVLIVDEAHELPESLLEELRILADQAEHGHPLVRLILAGQAGLEEKLVHPGLQALNQRVRAQVVLPPLTAAESRDYVDFRLTWAGARTAETFDDEALATLIQIADGSPRCLSQLCDHTLLLAYVAEQRPVTQQLVLEALEDLKHLPLRWNLPSDTPSRTATPTVAASGDGVIEWGPGDDASVSEVVDADPVAEIPDIEAAGNFKIHADSAAGSDHGELEVYRLSSELLDETRTLKTVSVFDDATPEVWSLHSAVDPDTVSQSAPDEIPVAEPSPADDEPAGASEALETTDQVIEEPVIDRYAALDAGLEPPAESIAAELPADEPVEFLFEESGLTWNAAAARLQNTADAANRLAAVQHVLEAVTMEVPEAPRERPAALPSTSAAAPTVFEFGADEPRSGSISSGPVTQDEPRSYRRLFTMLRRKQARS